MTHGDPLVDAVVKRLYGDGKWTGDQVLGWLVMNVLTAAQLDIKVPDSSGRTVREVLFT